MNSHHQVTSSSGFRGPSTALEYLCAPTTLRFLRQKSCRLISANKHQTCQYTKPTTKEMQQAPLTSPCCSPFHAPHPPSRTTTAAACSPSLPKGPGGCCSCVCNQGCLFMLNYLLICLVASLLLACLLAFLLACMPVFCFCLCFGLRALCLCICLRGCFCRSACPPVSFVSLL